MLEVEPLTGSHVPAVARLHASALAGDFLPSLGEPFLRTFYRSTLKSDLAFGFVQMEETGELAGFVLGSLNTSAIFRKIIRRNALRLGLSALPAVLRKPNLLLKVAETFFYPSREGATALQPAELLVIAVCAAQRSHGLGTGLVQALNHEFNQRGVNSYKVTVLQENQRANAFYQRLGFSLCGQFVLYGKGWNVYQTAISDQPSGNPSRLSPDNLIT